ncbi:MAG: LacI family DNA-binding transcriptional regulator [Planctomycetota bacterium]|jgi:DNA-binding LacI/PurR family transcriptional regulator|nr:LacI family DNA-binding transcriptional regulator [Planctomycetota bacterium]
MAVTLKDIAEAVGVSKRTVSEILNRKGKPYSPLTVEKVFATAERLGYRPNAQARAVASGRVGTIALVLGEQHYSHLPQELLHGIHNELAKHDLRLLITVLSDAELEDDTFMPDILTNLVCDAILINYHYRFPPRIIDAIDHYRVPAVWINVRNPTDAVCFDEKAGIYTLLDELVAQGHSRIYYVDRHLHEEFHHYSTDERLAAYRSYMDEHGLEGHVFGEVQRPFSSMVDEWLEQAEPPTAAVCYSQSMASDLAYLLLQRGLSVPKNFSLASFTRHSNGHPRISVMEQPWTALGRAAARLLLKRLDSDAPLPAETISLTLDQTKSDTIGPVPS